ncbi:MAG: DHHA1 domain-containing protein, partial [Elusimicrobiota bacterium]
FKYSVNIDHHKTGKFFAKINWITPKASSNSEQVYQLYRRFGFKPDKKESTWLYAGIIADTGRFQYSLTSPFTHEIAASLLATGMPHTVVAERLFMIKTEQHLRLLARALMSLRFAANGAIAVMRLTAQDFAAADNLASQTEDIVNYGLAPENSVIAVLFKEEPVRGQGVISVSLRSRGKTDISPVATAYGGGGHANAAGFEVTGVALDRLEEQVVDALKGRLGRV